MFKWNKLGKVFDPSQNATPDWMNEFAQAPSVLLFENFVRVYFSCRPKPDDNGQYVSYSAYVDLNRKNLFEILDISKEPILELGKLGTFDEFGTYPASVIKDDSIYKVYYAGWTRCESVPYNTAIGFGISKDNGQTFSKLGNGPLLSYSINEPMTISGPKIRQYNNKWYLFYVAGNKWIKGVNKPESVFKIRMAHSADGLNWTKLDKDIVESILEENECQASPDVFYHNNKYHMFFCYKYSFDFRNKERGYRIGYASSNDLITWIRDDSKAGIDISSEGWDSQMISYPHVFEMDGDIYMFYLGNDVGRFGFGLAQLEGNLE